MDFQTLFQVSQEDMEIIVNRALSRGGDYADLFFEYTTTEDIILRDKEVNTISGNIDFGVGIRVVSGEKTGYAFSESLEMKDMEKAALLAAAICNAGCPSFRRIPPEPVPFTDRYPIKREWELFPTRQRKEYLLELDRMIETCDSRIRKTTIRLSVCDSKIMFFNSLGDYFCDRRPKCALSATCAASNGSVTETVSFSRSYRMGAEMLSRKLQETVAEGIRKELEPLFEAGRPKAGETAVVMAAGASGILLHEAIGHAFEADFNRKGISIFSDKMGKKICSDKISVVDDATINFNRGALNVDDEGVPGQKTYMVRDGILESYLHDRISARHYGVPPTGNGRRESFRFNPIPRMRATYMEGGRGSASDIISSVRSGVYVENFTNGQVQIGAGDFTFYVKSGHLIENGRLTSPIKDINIIGNGPKALADIVEVASDGAIDDSSWTCGKEQSCPVSCGMPTVLVKSLIVGGWN